MPDGPNSNVQVRREDLLELMVSTVKSSGIPLRDQALDPQDIDEGTILFGGNGLYDSLGLVSFVLDIEQQVNDQYGLLISVADDRAMSQERSPFRNVASLADYVMQLVGEQEST